MSSRSGTIYVGVTKDLQRRVFEHKQKMLPSFTARYNVTKLVWFEEFSAVEVAISREKQIEGWRRSKKIDLILSENPSWCDLSTDC